MEVKLCIAKEARRKSNIEALEIKYGGIGMTLKEILEAGGGILFVVLTLVQVAPIKVNPWTVLGRSIGRVLNKEVMDKIEEGNAKNARYRIIRFNDEVKHDVKHTEEHFDQIIEDIDTDGGIDAAGIGLAVQRLGGTHQNRLVQIQHPGLIGHQRLIGAAVDLHIVWVGLVGLLPIGNGGKHAGVADLIGGVHLIDDHQSLVPLLLVE